MHWAHQHRSPGAAQRKKPDKLYQPARVARKVNLEASFFFLLWYSSAIFLPLKKNATNIEVFQLEEKVSTLQKGSQAKRKDWPPGPAVTLTEIYQRLH